MNKITKINKITILLFLILNIFNYKVGAASLSNPIWENSKNAKNVTGIISSSMGSKVSEYTFSPYQNGAKHLGQFSYEVFGNDKVCIAKKYNSATLNNTTSMFKKFYQNYYSTNQNVTITGGVEFNPNTCENYKGKIGVRYNNIGMYQGNKIDMKIYITNWTKRSGGSLAVNQQGINLRKNFGLSYFNLVGVSVKYAFYKAGTESLISVKGHWSFDEIDNFQSIVVNKSVLKDKNQWVGKNNVLHIASTKNGDLEYQHVFEKNGTNYDFTDSDKDTWGHEFSGSSISYQYKNNSFNFKKTMNKSLIGFGYKRYKPIKSALSKPEKWISLKGNLSGDNQELQDSISSQTKKANYELDELLDKDRKQRIWKYNIVQEITDQNTEHYYKSFKLEDKILDEFEIIKSDIHIYSSKNSKLVDDWFDINITQDNKVELIAKSNALNNSDFYGGELYFQIPVKLKENITIYDLEKYVINDNSEKGNTFIFNNSASTITDGATSNTSTTELIAIIDKSIFAPNPQIVKSSNGKILHKDKSFTYKIELSNPTNKDTKLDTGDWLNVVLKDTMSKGLNYVLGTLRVNGNLVDDKFMNNNELEINIGNIPVDNKVVVSFDVVVIDEREADNGDGKLDKKVTNYAYAMGEDNEGKKQDTSKVSVHDTLKDPIPEIIKKSNANGLNLGSVFRYSIEVGNRGNAGTWYDIKILDELPDYLEYIDNSTLMNNKKVSDEKIKWVNNKRVLENTQDRIEANEKIIISFDVKVIGVPDKVNEKGTPIIKNNVKATGENEAREPINPPPYEVIDLLLPKPSIEKKASLKEIDLNQVMEYSIIVKNNLYAGTWTNVVVNDDLKDYLKYEGNSTTIDSIIKTDKEDSDEVVWDNNKLLIKLGDLKSGESKIIKFKVKLIKDVKEDINNYVIAKGSNESNEEEVTIDDLEKTPIIEKVKLRVIKVDKTTNNKLSGAEFMLERINDDKSKTFIKKWISNKNEFVIEVKKGRYILTEIKAPLGYKVDKKIINLDVNKDELVKVRNTILPLPKTSIFN